MCGRYVIVSNVVTIEKKFNISISSDEEVTKNYNLGPGQVGPIITNDQPHKIQMGRFGYSRSWSEKKSVTINARVDSKEDNPNDSMDYFKKGGKPGIFQHTFWRSAIRKKRCIIFADAFYEGPRKEKLNKPYLVYLRNKQRPFAMAGVWDQFVDSYGIAKPCFAILTVPANKLLNAIGHHRSPLILPPDHVMDYLSSPLSDIKNLFEPFPYKQMNAYRVSNKMKSGKENNKELVNPIGQPILNEKDEIVVQELKLFGMKEREAKRTVITDINKQSGNK